MKSRGIISMALAILTIFLLSACGGDYSSSYIESCDYSCTASTKIDPCKSGCDYSYGSGQVTRIEQLSYSLYPRETVSSSVPLKAPPAIVVAQAPPVAEERNETAIGTAYIIERASIASSVPLVPPAAIPVAPVVTAMGEPPHPAPAVSVAGPCVDDVPIITVRDLFTSVGPRYLWTRPGANPVRGKSPDIFLEKLGYTEDAQRYFRVAIAQKQGVVRILKKRARIGHMTTGSGKVIPNTVVGFEPIRSFGKPKYQVRDNRVRVYTFERTVLFEGRCVKHVVKLLEPFVCGNWSRVSDEIIPVGTRAATKVKAKKKNKKKK